MSEDKNIDEVHGEAVSNWADFLSDLWNGKLGLAMTYWVYGVLGGIVWGVAIASLKSAQLDADALQAVWIIFAVYYFIVYVGIWQAATKYTGSKIWSVLAKFVVIIVVLPVVIKFIASN